MSVDVNSNIVHMKHCSHKMEKKLNSKTSELSVLTKRELWIKMAFSDKLRSLNEWRKLKELGHYSITSRVGSPHFFQAAFDMPPNNCVWVWPLAFKLSSFLLTTLNSPQTWVNTTRSYTTTTNNQSCVRWKHPATTSSVGCFGLHYILN